LQSEFVNIANFFKTASVIFFLSESIWEFSTTTKNLNFMSLYSDLLELECMQTFSTIVSIFAFWS